jgi:DNA polymerase III epsilon subunit-like protein
MTTGLLIGLLGLAGVGLLVALLLSVRADRRRRSALPPGASTPARTASPAPAARPAPAPAVRVSAPVPPLRADRPMPFAEPGLRGELFAYGGEGRGAPLDAPFAIIDVETTGFSPARGDRIVEIAITRIDARGRVEDEYATLVNPERDAGAVWVHGISNIDIRDAPRFADIAGEVLARMDGAVVVAHNAVFEERFLAAEFTRLGVLPPLSPALCTLWLARRTMRTPNHKLRTLARYAGLSTIDAHTALGDVRLVAALLPQMLTAHGLPMRYECRPRSMPGLPRGVRPKTRAAELRKGTDGWMASLMARLPRSAADARDVDAQRYLDALAGALADGSIIGVEAAALAALAGSAGLGAAQVADLHRRFLDGMKELALADDILTTAELRKLRNAADLLGLPGHFEGLRPTTPADLIAGGAVPAPRPAPRPAVPVAMPRPVPRCSSCAQPGHNRASCPQAGVVTG